MADDCYWKHGPSAEATYLCFDGESTVCPQCCVECCPAENPDWFAECAASGHPTWPSTKRAVPMKLVCLESSWDDRVFQSVSVRGFFDSLRPLVQPPLQIAHRFIESAQHLAHYTRQPDGLLWTDPNAWDSPIFYLAFHGSPGTVKTALDRIGPQMLCDAFRDYGSYPNLIYLGSCSVLAGSAGRQFGSDLLASSGSRAVIGYTTDVDWMNSLLVDLMFLYRFYTHGDPWNNLREIFSSIEQDFHPSREMGYTLMLPGEG